VERLVTYVTPQQRAHLVAEKRRTGLSLAELNRRALDGYFAEKERDSAHA